LLRISHVAWSVCLSGTQERCAKRMNQFEMPYELPRKDSRRSIDSGTDAGNGANPQPKVGMCQSIVNYMDAGRLLASSESIRRGHAALLSNYCGSHLSRINFTALVIVYSMNNKLKIQPC